jgi:glucosamine--fructose-6-phosphate aminotransferase (isomerizing)
VTAHACAVLPVRGRAREEFSQLPYHIFAGYVTSCLARQLGRLPFQADRPPRAPQGT